MVKQVFANALALFVTLMVWVITDENENTQAI